jgi:hypothetical protein
VRFVVFLRPLLFGQVPGDREEHLVQAGPAEGQVVHGDALVVEAPDRPASAERSSILTVTSCPSV